MKSKSIQKKIFMLFLSGLFAMNFAIAQENQITGKITDAATNEPLPGVNVIIKGTLKGAVTNLDGVYNIDAPQGSVVVYSFVGYKSQEVTIGTQNQIDIAIAADVTGLDEVLVIGYGTQKKTDKTGAVTNVGASELNTGVLTDPIQAIQGKASGVQITKKGGNPNDGFTVQIRGSASFGTNQPLYVIDGVPGVDPTTISTDDIESFNILKDASSCAIYGSRGANGVIIITTKRGKSGQNTLEFNSYLSVDKVAKRLDLLSASDIRNFIAKNNLTHNDAGANTDWQDEIFRTALTQNYSLSAGGGNEKSTYRLSGTWADFEGVVIGTDKKRLNLAANVTQKLFNDKLLIEGGINGVFEHNDYENFDGNGPNDIMYQAFQRSPLHPVKNPDGSYYENKDYNFQYYNPVAISKNIQNQRDAKRFRANGSAEFEIIKDLKARFNGSYSRDDDESFYFEPATAASTLTIGKGERKYNNINDETIEMYLSYSRIIKDKHSLNVIGGYSWQERVKDGFNALGTNAQSPSVTSNNLGGLADVSWGDIGSYKNSWTMISMYGRFIYNYDQRYAITGTVRRDGCSKFGANNKWGIFPSASIAWTLKNEPFLKDINLLSQLKLRIGYGLTGNAERVEPYMSLPNMGITGRQPNLDDGSNVIVFEQKWDPNPDLRWEQLEEENIGLDYGFFKNKVQGSLELYSRTIIDLIIQYSKPKPPSKTGNLWANAGQFRNKGVEFNIQVQVVDNSKFSYKTSLTYSRNYSEILKLSDESRDLRYNNENQSYINARGMVGQYTQIVKEGKSLGTWYLPHFKGFSKKGVMLFESASGGVSSDVNDITKVPRFDCGSALPKHNIGWSNYFTIYKNIDASIALHAVLDYKVYNVSKMYFSDPNLLPNLNANKQAVEWYGKIDGRPVASDYWLEDGSFVRLDNITVGYTLPKAKSIGITKLRIYATVNNIYTFTGYTGIDPELSYEKIEYGLDNFNTYPKTRSYIIGVQLIF